MGYRQRAVEKCGQIRDRLYPRETWATHRFRQEVLKSASPDGVILDVGCGRAASWLRSVTHAFGTCYGIDPEITCNSQGNMKLLQAGAYRIPLPARSVDVVAMRNVIEHLDDPERALRECMRVLRPAGSFFILAPNKWFPPLALGRLFPHSLRWRINRILGGAKEENTFPAYYRANTASALGRLARAAGFIPSKIECISEHPVYFTFSPLLYRGWAGFERRCLRQDSFAALRHYILCRLDSPP